MDKVSKCINGEGKTKCLPYVYPEKYLKIKKPVNQMFTGLISLKKWSHLGSNQGPPDYESGALTN